MTPAMHAWEFWRREAQRWIFGADYFWARRYGEKLEPSPVGVDRRGRWRCQSSGGGGWGGYRLDQSRDYAGSPLLAQESSPHTTALKRPRPALENSSHGLESASCRRPSRQLDLHPVNHKSFLENLKSQSRSIEIIALHVKGKRAPFSYKDLLQPLPPRAFILSSKSNNH